MFVRLLVPCGGFGKIGDAEGGGMFDDLKKKIICTNIIFTY